MLTANARAGGGVTAGAASAPVVPTFGGTLIAHWTADSGITQSGGFVSAWLDTVASLSLSQATGANQPKYLATGYNSRPALQFNGSGGAGFNSSMMQSSANALSITTQTFSYFATVQVLANTDATGFGRVFSYEGNGDANDGGLASAIPFLRNGTANSLDPFVAGTQDTTLRVTTALSTPYRIGLILQDAISLTTYQNGSQVATAAHGGHIATSGTVGLGANVPQSGANVWMDMIVREIVIYNIALSAGQITTLDAYLVANNGS